MIDGNTPQEQESCFVTFKKGLRTRPHIHATDQTLVGLRGKGIVFVVNKVEINSDGKSAIIGSVSDGSSRSSMIESTEGDVVYVSAGTLHWHDVLDNNDEGEL